MDIIEIMAKAHSAALGRPADTTKEWLEGPMRAALSAALDNGYALVPKEATEKMIAAADALSPFALPYHPGSPEEIYRAMIQAAPKVGI